jgi:hypothetical protein
MADKWIKKRSVATLSNVRLLGHRAVLIDVHYEIKGRIHTSYVIQTIEISLCEMEWLTVQFHNVMTELGNLWLETKRAMCDGRSE